MSSISTLAISDRSYWHLYSDLQESSDTIFLELSGDALHFFVSEASDSGMGVTVGISRKAAIELGLIKGKE